MEQTRATKRAQAQATKVALGQRIRALRQRLGLSQEELAYRAGVHSSYVSRIERAVENPALENLEAIARTLGVTVGDLFRGPAPRRKKTRRAP